MRLPPLGSLLLLAALTPLTTLAVGCETTTGSTPTPDVTATPPAPESLPAQEPSESAEPPNPEEPVPEPAPRAGANVVSVAANGSNWAVTLLSPDTGCDQYANWWEVVRPDGTLVYRRILGHSHVDEQPFTRSGGSIDVGDTEVVIVRAHMHPGGYGGTAMRGSKADGFAIAADIDGTFATNLGGTPPQPDGCAF